MRDEIITKPEDEPRAWLDTPAVQTVSDILLGGILLLAGAVAIWDRSSGHYVTSSSQSDATLYPTVVGGLLLLVGIGLLLRGAFLRHRQAVRWNPWQLLTVLVFLVVVGLAEWLWGYKLALQFGPPEFVALIVFALAFLIVLARLSRVRAAGMALLGLLLATVGLDAITGELRLTMGVSALIEGFDQTILLVGLVVVADAGICLVLPPLFLATYARWIVGFPHREISTKAALFMRIGAALVFAAACFIAYSLEADPWGVVFALTFGVFGGACKIFGWNRLALYLAFSWSGLLEENIRRALLLSHDDPAIFFHSPISVTLLSLAAAILVAAALLSAWRMRLSPKT